MSGLSRLRREDDDPFGRARTLALAMACASAAVLVLAAVLVNGGPMAASVLRVVEGAEAAGAYVTVWVIADAVIRRIRLFGYHRRAAVLDVLRWAVAGLGTIGLLNTNGYLNFGFIVLIAWLIALVAIIVEFYRLSRLSCLS
ncbi:hypothetical protein AB0L05_26760 [Nonomuraea pusilla]|uniref:hypothetical protein n=1 Tax=Nonomuraea pusilla TaxID=46177 RepID=UPI00332847A2